MPSVGPPLHVIGQSVPGRPRKSRDSSQVLDQSRPSRGEQCRTATLAASAYLLRDFNSSFGALIEFGILKTPHLSFGGRTDTQMLAIDDLPSLTA